MTGEELFSLWRPGGAKYWCELRAAEQVQWIVLASKVDLYGEGRYREGYNEGSDDGWNEGHEQAQHWKETTNEVH